MPKIMTHHQREVHKAILLCTNSNMFFVFFFVLLCFFLAQHSFVVTTDSDFWEDQGEAERIKECFPAGHGRLAEALGQWPRQASIQHHGQQHCSAGHTNTHRGGRLPQSHTHEHVPRETL